MTLATIPSLAVKRRAQWTDAWSTVSNVEVLSWTDAAPPRMSEAKIRFRIGDIMRPGESSFSNVLPESNPLAGYFIRIDELDSGGGDPTPRFYGYCPAQEILSAEEAVYTVYGLQYLLQRAVVTTVKAQMPDDSVGTLQATIPFNDAAAYGRGSLGNRTSVAIQDGGRQYYMFGAYGYTWTARDIVEHLLYSRTVRGLSFGVTGQDEMLDAFRPSSLDPHNRNLYDLLNALIQRKRGVGWRIVVNEDAGDGEDELAVDIYSLFATSVTVGSLTIPQNDRRTAGLDLTDAIALPMITSGTDERYGSIEVRGERVTSVFSLQLLSGASVPGWTLEQEQAYRQATDEQRASDEFGLVFTTFLLKDSANLDKANVAVNDDGTIDATTHPPLRPCNRRLLRELPLVADTDVYERPVYRKAFAVAQDPASGRYYYIDQMDEAGMRSASLAVLDTDAGIHLRCRPFHLFAPDWRMEGAITETPSQANYEYMYATVGMQTDTHLRYVVDMANGYDDRLYIDVPGAELWYIAQDTVTGIDEQGDLVSQAEGSVLRTDVDRLQRVAAIAQAWYAIERHRLEATLAGLVFVNADDSNEPVEVGTYMADVVTHEGLTAVGSVISAITYNFVRGTTKIETDYASLDLPAFR